MKTPTQRRAGFTLIELLVAMSITAIIVTVLVSITAIAIDVWNRSRSELRAARQAKSMVDSMARDFESLVVRSGNDFEWLIVETDKPSNSTNAASLIFFTAATDRYNGEIGKQGVDLGGDVSAVGYKLDWRDPIATGSGGQFQTFVLNRKLVDPKPAFDSLLGKQNITAPFNALGDITESKNFICENVSQFTITFNLEVPSTTTPPGSPETRQVIIEPSGGVQKFRITGLGIETTPPNTQLKAAKLKSVGISLTVVSDSGIDLLRNSPGRADDPSWMAKNSFQYSKLVHLPGM